MYVCLCHGISETRLQQAIEEGARSFEQLQSCTGVATCCGACEPCAREMLDTATLSPTLGPTLGQTRGQTLGPTIGQTLAAALDCRAPAPQAS